MVNSRSNGFRTGMYVLHNGWISASRVSVDSRYVLYELLLIVLGVKYVGLSGTSSVLMRAMQWKGMIDWGVLSKRRCTHSTSDKLLSEPPSINRISLWSFNRPSCLFFLYENLQ